MALNFAQLEQVWTNNGGDPKWAPVMAGIALAESGGDPGALNNNPATNDYSIGLWQINYYNGLGPGRTQRYGPAESMKDPNNNARAAIDLWGNGTGASNWAGDAVGNAYLRGQLGSVPSASAVQSVLSGAGLATGGGAPGTYTPPAGGGGSSGQDDSTCVVPLPLGGCLLNRSQARAVVGGAAFVGGGVLMLVAIMRTAGFKAPKIVPIPLPV